MSFKEDTLISDTRSRKKRSEGCEMNNVFAVRFTANFAMYNNIRCANAIKTTKIRILKVGLNAVHFAFKDRSYSYNYTRGKTNVQYIYNIYIKEDYLYIYLKMLCIKRLIYIEILIE